MAIRTSAVDKMSKEIQVLQRNILQLINEVNLINSKNGKQKIENAERNVAEYKLALIRCRDVIEDLWRNTPDKDFELKQETAIFLSALSFTIGDSGRSLFKDADTHNSEIRAQQAKVREAAEKRAKEVAKETNAKRRAATTKKGKKKS